MWWLWRACCWGRVELRCGWSCSSEMASLGPCIWTAGASSCRATVPFLCRTSSGWSCLRRLAARACTRTGGAWVERGWSGVGWGGVEWSGVGAAQLFCMRASRAVLLSWGAHIAALRSRNALPAAAPAATRDSCAPSTCHMPTAAPACVGWAQARVGAGDGGVPVQAHPHPGPGAPLSVWALHAGTAQGAGWRCFMRRAVRGCHLSTVCVMPFTTRRERALWGDWFHTNNPCADWAAG